MKLTAAQLEVLRMCAEKPRVTSKKTAPGLGWVSGIVAAALVRKGFIAWERGLYAITDTGRAALINLRPDVERSRVPFDMETVDESWRRDSARKANRLHKDGRKPTVDRFLALRTDELNLTADGDVSLEEALERVRLDVLANPDKKRWSIVRQPKEATT